MRTISEGPPRIVRTALMSRNMRGNSSGFTLVEVMIVVFLLAIVGAIALPAVNNTLDGIKLNAATREVLAALQYAQSLTIKEGHSYGVEFETGPETVTCYDTSGSATIRNPIDKKLYVLDFSAAGPLQGVGRQPENHYCIRPGRKDKC